MRLRFTIAALLTLALAAPAAADDYPPALCPAAVPYEGPSLRASGVDLAAARFAIDGALDDSTRQRLAAALGDVKAKTHAPAITAAVATGKGLWHASLGPDSAAAPLRFYWASAGKALTAVVVLQLVEEGKLSLDDSLSKWIAYVPNASAITVDHLLRHTSGLFSANEDLRVRKDPRYRTPRENIQISAKHGAMFCPGRYWRYTNTGYTLLGQIIEAVDHRPYHEAVNARIGDRLGLPGLRALAPRMNPPDVPALTPTDGSKPQIQPSWPFAAGSVVGSAEDMIRFWHALLNGRLLSDANTAAMFEKLYPMSDTGPFYGRGVMVYDVPDPSGRIWIGHSGGTPGAKAVVAFSMPERAWVAVALTGDGSSEASANLLLDQLR